MTAILIILLLTIIITPTVFCPLRLIDGYIFPQLGIATIGIGITTILLLFYGVFPCNLSILLALLFFIYCMISGSWSTVPHNSLRDIPLIFVSVFSFIIAQVFFSFGDINILCIGITVISVLTSIYAILQSYCIDPFFPLRLEPKLNNNSNEWYVDDRGISTLGNTNFAAGFFCSTLPFIAYLCIQVSAWFIVPLLIILAGIIRTRSRNALLAILTGSFLFLVIISRKGIIFDIFFYLFADLRIEIILVLITLVLMGGSQLYFWGREKNPLSFLSEDCRLNNMLDFSNTHQDHYIATLRYRIRYWISGLELFFRRPLQGYGLRTYRKEVYDSQVRLNTKDPNYLGPDYQTPQPRECHNDYLENFVEGGIIGGFLFLGILTVVLYNCHLYFHSGGNVLLLAGILAGISCTLVNAFFFFPLRLAPSALMFWMSLGLMEYVTGGIKLFSFAVPGIAILFIGLILAAVIWEGAIKPNLGNYYFMEYQLSRHKKYYYLDKALSYCPYESIYLTHLVLNYMWTDPNQADQQAERLRRHYDGMVPAWAMTFNCGLAKMLTKNYQDALRYFTDSIKYYPSFGAAKEEYKRVFPLAPFPRQGGALMKRISDEALKHIQQCELEINNARNNMNSTLANLELSIITVLQHEKLRMNIPMDWPYDMESQMYIPPDQVAGRPMAQMGPTKFLIIPKSQPQG